MNGDSWWRLGFRFEIDLVWINRLLFEDWDSCFNVSSLKVSYKRVDNQVKHVV